MFEETNDFVILQNSLDAFIPELWANEALMVLEENLLMYSLVYKDFSTQIASFGDVVNTRKPGKFVMGRKIDGQKVVQQSAQATNVQVPLNQHGYNSFLIYDVEASKSFQELSQQYLVPAIKAIAKGVDEVLLAQKYQFMGNNVGKLGTAITRPTLIEAQTKLDTLLCPEDQRYAVITPTQKGSILNVEAFTDADRIGDTGTAVRTGSIGKLFGIDWLQSQNNRTVAATATKTAAVNKTGGYAAGAKTIAFDGGSGTLYAGEWCTIAGDGTPQFITANAAGSLTITPGIKSAVANDAVITIYTGGAVNLTAGYDAGWANHLAVDGFATGVGTGQMFTIGTSATADRYGNLTLGVLADGSTPSATTSLLADRPLAATVANDAIIGPGPAGDYGFVFHPNAIAFVSRPLALPNQANVRAAVVNYNGLSIRVVMGYDMDYQATKVTVDLLYGVKVLDTDLGCVLFS